MLYGRSVEREAIGALLEGARGARSGVLVLRGEPGVGKSALLEDARDRAADMYVLAARGVEAESELPFAALHQLIRPALGHLEQVPAPQADALRGALGLGDAGGAERFLVFAGCLSLLSELAERRPVLCLVDDAHWLDAASADALRFVGRRLGAEGIALLFAARDDGVDTFEAHDLPELAVKGLDADAAATLLDRRVAVAPDVRDRLVAQTQGNALALVELPAALEPEQLAGTTPLPEILPVPRQLERVFAQRAQELPTETQRLLLLAAADDSEELSVVTRAGEELGIPASALDAAEEARLVEVRGRHLEFRHPLVRSAIYGAATSTERRGAHAALARALRADGAGADRRVWHLAASALGGDDDVLVELDEAAARAEARNAHVAAAKALARAAELSPNDAGRGRRLVRAAANLSVVGRDDEAVALANAAAPLADEPVLRAGLAEVHAMAAIRGGRTPDVVGMLVDAATAVGPVDAARALELLMVARMAAWQGGDHALHLKVSQLASTVTPRDDDEDSQCLARTLVGFAEMTDGDPVRGAELLRETIAWGARAARPAHAFWASLAAVWLADTKAFGELVNRTATLARERGEVGILADALGLHAMRLAVEQHFDDASVAATEAIALVRELRAANLELLPHTALAVVAAFRGRDEEARELAEGVVARATASGHLLRASTAVYALAIADMAAGRWSDAVDRLDALRSSELAGFDPVVTRTIPDKIEAAVRAGRREEVRSDLAVYEERVERSSDPSARPRVAASRALLSDGDEASRWFEEALRLKADALPLDLARIQLLYGEHLRRGRRRAEARLHLRGALEAFERLGAEPWAERARAELRASGETARKRDPSTVTQLTPQELQVARLVADGLSNKEVAAQLFLSPRTIDAHLRSVFAKLGITSRTQLARLALADEAAAPRAVPALA